MYAAYSYIIENSIEGASYILNGHLPVQLWDYYLKGGRGLFLHDKTLRAPCMHVVILCYGGALDIIRGHGNYGGRHIRGGETYGGGLIRGGGRGVGGIMVAHKSGWGRAYSEQ